MISLQEPRALLRTICDPVSKTIANIRVVQGGESIEEAARYCKVPRWLVERWVKEGAPPGSPFEESPKPAVRVTNGDNRKLMAVVRNNPNISVREAMALSNYPASEQRARKRITKSNAGPKKTKLPVDDRTLSWVQSLNQELQSVIDLFDEDD